MKGTRAQDLEGLRAAGRAVAQTLAAMGAALTPGMTTAELDALGAKLLAEHGARSAPQRDYRFPGATCISLNEEAAHGIPGPRTLAPGDIVNIDVSAELDGYSGDPGATFLMPPAASAHEALLAATQAALEAAMAVAQPGALINEIGRAIESTARAAGFTTLRDLGSHGVGRKLHEAPRFIPNFFDPTDRRRLAEGMVITIEPFLSLASERCTTADDGWTLLSGPGNRSAQFEHTLVITAGGPEVMTRP